MASAELSRRVEKVVGYPSAAAVRFGSRGSAPATKEKGIVQVVIVPMLQEAKPIAETVAAGWAVRKLTQKNPPPDSPKRD